MSYEGYTQVLCANGHYRQYDAYEREWTEKPCHCGAAFVWSHEVDDTNCEGEAVKMTLAREAEFQTCDLGHKHQTKERTYIVPPAATSSLLLESSPQKD